MNENQQTQGWYGCDSCRKPFSFNEVNRYCLDDSVLNTKLYCILCLPCNDKQLWDKKQTGCFPLMIGCPPNQEIKTQGFKRWEESERVWQIKSKGFFKCDYCSQLILLGFEKVYDMTMHENTPEIAYLKYCLVCFPCQSILDKGSINHAKFDWIQVEAEKSVFPTFKTPTLIKYEKCKKQLGKDYENERALQEYWKKEQERKLKTYTAPISPKS